ncbi:transmembrane protein 241 isoform X2 [Sapajus apella]|uniref:Transmembrane protein 241 isoform X2 n=1 Tax=Sapajus apella TaxID=9515 RepID=A0A6J3J3F0_SAPAP|nr:transmembrane protein 241 isoform X2 [Sapajus apella]
MCVRRSLVGLTFCTCYLASYLTNKYVLSVLKFTYPTLFQGWQTLIGGLLLHVSWKLGWVEINSSSRSHVLAWLPASVLFVGIIYAGSRALSRLAIPVFLTLHNVAEVIICGYQKCFRKEKTSPAKICSALFLLAAAGCLPFNDSQFDPDGYFWALIHLFCLGAYKILQKFQKPSALSVVLLAFASHPTGDLFSVLDFPFLYFYRFHGSCCASGFLGFFLMFSTVKLKSLLAPGQCAAWIFFAKVVVEQGGFTCREKDTSFWAVPTVSPEHRGWRGFLADLELGAKVKKVSSDFPVALQKRFLFWFCPTGVDRAPSGTLFLQGP